MTTQVETTQEVVMNLATVKGQTVIIKKGGVELAEIFVPSSTKITKKNASQFIEEDDIFIASSKAVKTFPITGEQIEELTYGTQLQLEGLGE